MENNNFDANVIINEIRGKILFEGRIDEILNDCIREIQNPDNSYDTKLYIMKNILLFQDFYSTDRKRILGNTLINEINTTQNNDYKFEILFYIGNSYFKCEDQLYNYSIELINNENYNNRKNKASLVLTLLSIPSVIQNHKEQLYNLLEQFHDEIVNTNYLRSSVKHIYEYKTNLFKNHIDFIENLYIECIIEELKKESKILIENEEIKELRNRIEKEVKEERKERIKETDRREKQLRQLEKELEREKIEEEIRRERRATFYDENKPLTLFMQEIVFPVYLSFENFEALPLKQLTSKVDNAYVALRGNENNIKLQNNLTNARNEFLNALKTLNDEDKKYLLAGIYRDLNEPAIFIMETNNKKHNINKELKEKTGIYVDDLKIILQQRQQNNNNQEENFVDPANQSQPQVQELHDNNNINIVQEENNIQEEIEAVEVIEEIQQNIQEVQQQNNNQQQNGHFVQQLNNQRNEQNELDEHGFPRRGGHRL